MSLNNIYRYVVDNENTNELFLIDVIVPKYEFTNVVPQSTKTYAARTEDIITSLKCLYKTITSSFFFVKIYTISIRSRS